VWIRSKHLAFSTHFGFATSQKSQTAEVIYKIIFHDSNQVAGIYIGGYYRQK
jgi:hypothetical protein